MTKFIIKSYLSKKHHNILGKKMETDTKTIEVPKFREIEGTTISLFVLDNLKVDHPTAMRLLNKAGLRPLEDIEILPLLIEDGELRKQMETDKCYWLAKSPQGAKHGMFAIHGKKLIRKGITIGKNTPTVENTVHVDLDGENPPVLKVFIDYDVEIEKCRFEIESATQTSWYGKPLALGVPKDKDLEVAKREIKISKLQKEIRRANAELVKLRRKAADIEKL
jgi:hypothetical protein